MKFKRGNPNSELVAKIDARLKIMKLSDRKASLKAGLHADSIRNIKRGSQPRSEALEALAPVLGVDPSYFFAGGHVVPAAPDHPPITHGSLRPGLVEVGGTEFVSIARYDARLSAGPGAIIDPHAEPLGYHLVEASWLRAITKAKPDVLALLQVDGDSMEDTLHARDWVLIDRSQRRFAGREQIYALQVGEVTWIKRLSVDLAQKKIQVISDNKKYPVQLVDEDDVRILGSYLALIWRTA